MKGEEKDVLEISQSLLFLRKFFHKPKQIGSIWPSSSFLAKRMVRDVPWDRIHSIAELGSGTGAITSVIQTRTLDSANVFLFEKDKRMKDMLQQEFPTFKCYANALSLTEAIKEEGLTQLDCIISGLPFFNFPKELRSALLDQIVEALRPGGYFIAFQYSLQMRKELSNSFIIEKINFVPINMPPAFVYICRKQ